MSVSQASSSLLDTLSTPSIPWISQSGPSTLIPLSSSPPSLRSVPTESSIPQTVQKSIWVYFRLARGTEVQTGEVVQNGKRRQKMLHYCISCSNEPKPKVWHTVYTSAAQHHVKTKHMAQWKEYKQSTKEERSSLGHDPRQILIEKFALSNTNTARDLVLRQAYNKQRHIQAMIALCARRRLPLSAVGWPELHELLLSVNPEIDDLAPFGRRSLDRLLKLNFKRYKKQLQNHLQEAIGDIHISTDMCSSPARRAYLAICARWIDHTYRLRHGLLALPQILFSHSGQTQVIHIINVLRSYGILTKLGFHTDDNATSNDTLLQELAQLLKQGYQVCLYL
jgi:hypothetical protein